MVIDFASSPRPAQSCATHVVPSASLMPAYYATLDRGDAMLLMARHRSSSTGRLSRADGHLLFSQQHQLHAVGVHFAHFPHDGIMPAPGSRCLIIADKRRGAAAALKKRTYARLMKSASEFLSVTISRDARRGHHHLCQPPAMLAVIRCRPR